MNEATPPPGPEPCSLTDRGRELADEIAERFWVPGLRENETGWREAWEYAADHGFEEAVRGSKRTVLTVPDEHVVGDFDCVLKVAYRLYGYAENLGEVDSWERMPEAARQYVVPVWESGGENGWLLMPWADGPVSSAGVLDVWAGLTDAGWVCRNANWDHNLGKLAGRPVITDYGQGCYRRSGSGPEPADRYGGTVRDREFVADPPQALREKLHGDLSTADWPIVDVTITLRGETGSARLRVDAAEGADGREFARDVASAVDAALDTVDEKDTVGRGRDGTFRGGETEPR